MRELNKKEKDLYNSLTSGAEQLTLEAFFGKKPMDIAESVVRSSL